MLACHLANSIVDWDNIRGLVVIHLITLDKCPGVHLIGIGHGETLQRILGKTVALVTCADLEEVCGVGQLSSGLHLGLEGSIHALFMSYLRNIVIWVGVYCLLMPPMPLIL